MGTGSHVGQAGLNCVAKDNFKLLTLWPPFPKWLTALYVVFFIVEMEAHTLQLSYSPAPSHLQCENLIMPSLFKILLHSLGKLHSPDQDYGSEAWPCGPHLTWNVNPLTRRQSMASTDFTSKSRLELY